MAPDVWGRENQGLGPRKTRPAGRCRCIAAGAGAVLARAQQPAPRQAPAPRRPPAEPGLPPVVFVHGNGDSSALWINNIWRFEANGYRRNQLFAIDFTYPNARRDDAKPEPFRSSTEDQMKELAAFVTQVREGHAPAPGGAGRPRRAAATRCATISRTAAARSS